MKCVMCGNKLGNETRDIFRRIDNRRVRIIDVPVEVCLGCGDVYIDDQEIEVIDRILEELKSNIDNTIDPIVIGFNKSTQNSLIEFYSSDRL